MMMDILGSLRAWVARNVSLLLFLAFYFLTVVAGNLIYATPYGEAVLASAGMPDDALRFDTTFTLGYWTLLLMPLVAVPVGVAAFRPLLSRFVVGPIVSITPEFRRADYLVILALVAGAAYYALWQADAFALVANAVSAKEAIDARFELQERMSFAQKVAIHSLLPFMTFYALSAAIKTRETFWTVTAIVTVAITCVALVSINMKWPVLVFYIGAVSGIFIFSRRWPYVKAVVGAVGLVALYLAISTYVFRWVPQEATPAPDEVAVDAPAPEMPKGPWQQKPPKPSIPNKPTEPGKPSLDYSDLAGSSVNAAPLLLTHAVSRMAISFPYYYKIFTDEGPICGTLIATYLPGKKPCAPTFLVYSVIFPNDGYTGRGSAPAAPHVTAYAQQGWIGAGVGMLVVVLALSAFSAIPLASGAMAGAFVMVGATVGYHYSQLPIEGPVFYDHGIFWPLLLVGLYTAYRYASAAMLAAKAREVDPVPSPGRHLATRGLVVMGAAVVAIWVILLAGEFLSPGFAG
jgi:hypothetical protein